MELPFLLHNGIKIKPGVLGENALLLEFESDSLEIIHSLAELIEGRFMEGIVDVIPAYQSLAIVFKKEIWNHNILLIELEKLTENNTSQSNTKHVFEVPVCYDLGIDWDEMVNHTGLLKNEIIELHSTKVYIVAMMGFIPGFVFLSGLDEKLSAPRKSSPRTEIPSGSVGIGGNQTGIYSLESPGGWNIIGKTPNSFFDISQNPPTKLKAGDQIKFKPISKKEFYGE